MLLYNWVKMEVTQKKSIIHLGELVYFFFFLAILIRFESLDVL